MKYLNIFLAMTISCSYANTIDTVNQKSWIHGLVDFSNTHPVSAVMGTHIEMSNIPGKDYPAGSTYHPDEAGLALSVQDLKTLNRALGELGTKPQKKTMPKFIISPIGALQRYVGGLLGWLKKKIN